MANTDITRRKPLEDKLYKNEDLFRSIAACTPDHIIVQDNDLRYTYVMNPQLGLTEKDMLGKTDYDFLSKEEAEKLTLIKKEVINTGKQVKCETFLTSKDGKKEFFDGAYIPRFDLDGKVDGLIGYFRNRTGHKLIENALVESEKSLKAAQSLAQIGSWQWTMATDTIKWSEELCLINGHDPRLPPPGFAEMSSFYTPESWARLIEVVTKALNSGESYELYLDLVRTDGNIRKTLSRGLADYDVSGKIIGLHGTVQDITERKLAEEKLEYEHSILTALINSTGDTIIFTLDRGYCYTAFNEKHREEMKRIWNAEIKTGMNLLYCMQIPELRESAKQSIDRALTGEVLSEIQHQPEHNIYYEIDWNPIWQNKEVVGVTALIKDITKKRQSEEALKVNETLFRELFDNMTSGSAIFKVLNDGSKGSDYIIKKINHVGLKMEGKELEEIVGKRFIDIRPAIDSYGLIPVMKKVWETGESAIFQTKLYSDKRYSNYYANYVFKLPSGEVVTLYNDLTESRRAVEELVESEERFRMIASNTPDHILIQDDELRYTLVVNPQLGLTEQEMLGKTDYDFLSKEDAENLTRIKRQVIDTGKQVKCEIFLNSKNGKKDFFDGVYIPRFDVSGKCVGLIGYFRNITERKNAEEDLRLEKENFRHSLDDSPLGIRIVSQQGKTIYVNQTLLDFYGFNSLEELQKVPLENRYTHESFVEAQERKTARVNGTFTATNYNVSILAKNGETRHLKGYSKKVLWDGIWQFQIIYEDITEIKTREIELENSREQLEQLNLYLQRVREEERKLISRELHDELGQALTAIKIDLGILKNSLINKNSIIPKIDKISSLINDSITTVQRLTSELRPHILDDLGLVPAIEWYTGEYIKRTGISINLDIDKSISLPTEIELVIFRILQESLTNIARHSKAGTAEIFFYRQKSDVLLEIKDDGIGISAVDRKSPKSLGLFNMNERAREIGGTFVIESRKKRGTRICLTVPDILFEE